jgi:GT2 family glycosyltransferase
LRASVVVVTHAGAGQLEDSLPSLEAQVSSDDVELIVVDNGSPGDCSAAAARRYPWARVIRSDTNLGFAGGVNLGADAAEGDVLVLLNDDAAAEPDFVEAHLRVLDAHPDAAATGGRLLSWDGARHDFVRGGVTFDVHAFQIGQGWPVDQLDTPEDGEPLPFACGGNTAIRRTDWEACGGFDGDLFAYFEDVDLGWRLLAAGRQVVAAPDAVARHRGAATSAALGDFRRGVLFERNALRTFFACADDELRVAFAPAVLATFLHRLVAFGNAHPELAPYVADPFGVGAAPPSMADRWRRRLREQGVLGTLRHALARVVLGRRAGSPTVDDGHLLMQLRAAQGFFSGIEDTEKRRRALQDRRTVPDRTIVEWFPRLIVPTYPGDEVWFASDAFRGLLPDGWPVRFVRLEEILHPSLLR